MGAPADQPGVQLGVAEGVPVGDAVGVAVAGAVGVAVAGAVGVGVALPVAVGVARDRKSEAVVDRHRRDQQAWLNEPTKQMYVRSCLSCSNAFG